MVLIFIALSLFFNDGIKLLKKDTVNDKNIRKMFSIMFSVSES